MCQNLAPSPCLFIFHSTENYLTRPKTTLPSLHFLSPADPLALGKKIKKRKTKKECLVAPGFKPPSNMASTFGLRAAAQNMVRQMGARCVNASIFFCDFEQLFESGP